MNTCIPRFSDKEYARRYNVIREGMKRQGIDCLLVPSSENITYLTNIDMVIFGVHALLPLTGEPTVLLNDTLYRSEEDVRNSGYITGRYYGGEASTTIHDSSVIKDIRGVSHPLFVSEIVRWIRERGYDRGTIGVAGREVDFGPVGYGLIGITGPHALNPFFLKALSTELPEVTFVDATSIISSARMIKSIEEIESIRKASRLVDLCGEALAEAMKEPGVTESDLFAAYWNTIYRNGGGGSWWFMAATTQTASPREYSIHISPQTYTLQQGDMFIGELFPTWRNGYVSHLDVCFVKGQPAQKAAYEKMNEVCLECYHAVVASLRIGTTMQEVVARGESPLAAAGFVRGAPLLYSIGLYGMEPMFAGLPDNPAFAASNPLQANMTVNVIAHVYDRETHICVRTGSTHLITETGSECLNNTSFPRGMVVV